STAGGIYTAFERAERVGCTAIQVFTKNSNQWNDPVLSHEDIEKYSASKNKSKVRTVVSHDSYLINLCAANDTLLEKSRIAFIQEIKRCQSLDIGIMVFHPGAHTTMDRKESLKLVADSLNHAHSATMGSPVVTAIETTAGQGTTVGSSFGEIAEIMSYLKYKERVAVCVDTCHIFAAGYDIRTKKGYEKVMSDFHSIIGFEKLCTIHFNDAKKPLNSHVDRHEHIGKGQIGKPAFGFFMNDERFPHVPKILETPKGEDGCSQDIQNFDLVLSLLKR
ncbi:MAG: deoxyribonuclease IV, partial [Bacteroidetes bacterium]|nr:deoxyribonuclease IV [Bacteroidota bacterium]